MAAIGSHRLYSAFSGVFFSGAFVSTLPGVDMDGMDEQRTGWGPFLIAMPQITMYQTGDSNMIGAHELLIHQRHKCEARRFNVLAGNRFCRRRGFNRAQAAMKNRLFEKFTSPLLIGKLAAATITALCILYTPCAWAAGQTVLHGHVPAAAAHSQPVDRLPGSAHLELAIGLHVRNGEMLTNLLQQIYDPASVNYRHYLTPAQFAENFGATESDYQAVIAFAKANGLTVGATHSNRLLLEVGGTVADIEKAFHVNLRTYKHPTEARTFFAPDVEPSVDSTLQVVDISGLDNFIVPHPMSLKPAPITHIPTPAAGSGPSNNFVGVDFRKAYVPGVSLNGAGQTVGLLEFDGYYAADIASYESLAGLASVPLQNVLLNHVHGNAGANNSEVALDIEMAVSMAPGLAKIIVYEGSSGNTILSRMATDNLAKQISASWTYGINATTETLFQQFAAQGQSFFNASGDSDAYSGAVAPPTDDPNITVVGGTTLTTDSLGAWASETVWNWGGGTGTGGGISTINAIPSWQQGVSMSANHGSVTMRNLPDVALTADNIWVIYNNGTGGSFGGTSCAAPLWAAFTALVNQQALANGRSTVGFVNPAIYAIGTGPNYASLFHDTTTGDNTSSKSPTNFFAVTSYDLCTGWGTPVGAGLINALAGTSNQPPAFSSNPFNEASATASVPYSATLATNASDPNGGTMTFSKISGPAWLSVAGNGALSGMPSNSDAGTNSFVVRTVDSFSLSNSATMLLMVNSNLPPVFTTNPFSLSSANSGQSYSGTIATNASDPNGGTLTFSKVSGPAWLGVAGNGALSGTPANSDAGTNSFVVRVTDGGGLSNNATMTIFVNGAPSFTSNPFSHPGINAGQPYSGTIATNATDPNGDTLAFSKISGPAWLSIAVNGALSGTAANTNSGTNSFIVRATDSVGLFSNAVMTIYVNGAPSFTSNPFSHAGVNAGQPYSGTIATNATDPNGDLLTFAKVSGPAWLAVAANGTLSGTAANADAGTNSFVVSTTDPGGLSSSATMTIYVNGAPSFTSNPIIKPGVNAGQLFSGTIATNATDPNADILTFAKVSGPAWLTVATNGVLSGTAANTDAGTNSFVVRVTDPGGLSNSATMTIYVNGAPSFTSNPIIKPGVNAGQLFSGTIATNATDPNADILTFAKVSGPAWLTVATNGLISGTAANTDAGTNSFVVRVTDPGGLSNSAAMTIYVNAAPSFTSNPIIKPGVNAGQLFSGTIATNATDPNADILTFAKVSGPAWLTVATNGVLSGTAANTDAGTNSFVVSATDPGGLSSSATMTIYVNGAPSFTSNPIIKPGVNAGQLFSGTIATNATDPNADILTFAKVSGPAWLTVATNGVLSGTAANTDAGTNSFVVSATDPGGLSNSATMTIYVNGAPAFTSNPIIEPSVNAGQLFSGTIVTNATDPNADILTFAKVSGPAWLTVATNGVLSGTAADTDVGTNSFVVRVTDPGGLFDSASMNIVVAAIPKITMAISPQANNLVLSWNGGVAPYQLQVATNLLNPSWDNVGGPIATNSLSITPTNWAAFYRIYGQ